MNSKLQKLELFQNPWRISKGIQDVAFFAVFPEAHNMLLSLGEKYFEMLDIHHTFCLDENILLYVIEQGYDLCHTFYLFLDEIYLLVLVRELLIHLDRNLDYFCPFLSIGFDVIRYSIFMKRFDDSNIDRF
jgi:hypothetical protein